MFHVRHQRARPRARTARFPTELQTCPEVTGSRRVGRSARLQQLRRHTLEGAGRRDISHHQSTLNQSFALFTHALYAEDFFTVWNRALVWPTWAIPAPR